MLLPPSLIDRLARIGLLARRRFPGSGPGERATRRAGGRTEFSGHRAYAAGDDFRDIDWNLAARSDQVFVREFQREEGVPVRIVVDASASMACGQPPKFDQARRVAGGLAVIALARHHRVEVWRAIEDDVTDGHRFSGPAAIPAALDHLEGWSTGRTVAIARSIASGRRRSPGAALTLWITDGYGDPVDQRALLGLPSTGDDGVVLLISSRQEIDPGSLDGNVRLTDVETGQALEVAIGPAERAAYREAFARFAEEWRRRTLTAGLRFAWLTSDQPLDDVFFGTLPRAGILG